MALRVVGLLSSRMRMEPVCGAGRSLTRIREGSDELGVLVAVGDGCSGGAAAAPSRGRTSLWITTLPPAAGLVMVLSEETVDI